jgi:hypothetical protein
MSLVDSKYIGLVSVRLQKFVKKKDGLYNFRCPYCGDSRRHKNKATGIFVSIIKTIIILNVITVAFPEPSQISSRTLIPLLHDQYVFERYKEGLQDRGSNTPEPVQFKFEKPDFSKNDFDLPKISELNTTHPAKKFLNNRRIPE